MPEIRLFDGRGKLDADKLHKEIFEKLRKSFDKMDLPEDVRKQLRQQLQIHIQIQGDKDDAGDDKPKDRKKDRKPKDENIIDAHI